jgi:hypothetical protein
VTVIGDESSVTEVDDAHINDLIDQYMNDHPIQTEWLLPILSSMPPIESIPVGYMFGLNITE